MGLFGVLRLVRRLAAFHAARRSRGHGEARFRDDRPQRAELSSRRRHDRYRGQAEVPCGAFAKGFIGPSPPPGEIHTYEFTVKALGANGTALATTTARRKFPE